MKGFIKDSELYEKIKSQISELYKKFIYETSIYKKFSTFYDLMREKTTELRKEFIRKFYGMAIPNKDFNGFFSEIFLMAGLVIRYLMKGLIGLLKIILSFLKPYIILIGMLIPLALMVVLIIFFWEGEGDSIVSSL